MIPNMSRRTLLSVVPAALSVPLLLSSVAMAQSVPSLSKRSGNYWPGRISTNGWPIIDSPPSVAVEGSSHEIRVAEGMPAALLTYVARRYHYEIHELEAGDLVSHTADRMISDSFESNYLSGTAISIRAKQHPVGAQDTYFVRELRVIEDILRELDGAVVWGGHFTNPAPAHFEIAQSPASRTVEKAAIDAAAKTSPWKAGNIGQPTLPTGN
ncbi:hypothetical protein [Curtobacterium sp. S6]|uniref:hypothetical protein n=1 Tax=Curtobacterium sp. S6 TaxID=1479623 RepID=UPI00128EEAA2|nr:hypothetical protein [Curtobacterium sp. S6]